MNKVLLIDADSKIPNLALMKLSTFYKTKGYTVDLIKLNISYYPNRKNILHVINNKGYDKTFCSVIFDNSIKFIKGENIEFGGTGYNIKSCLPDKIESCFPDYTIYPENNISYKFISRGCIRKCSFCKVPEKEGNIKQVNTIDKIIQHKKVKFMDNNFLALPNHKEILKDLIKSKIRFQFNQGLDIRLIDEENSELLKQCNYLGEYIFAFDSWGYKATIGNKLNILGWRKDYRLKFFVYTNSNMEIDDTIKRVLYLRNKKCLPYIMRDINCWESEYSPFYIDLSAWCNQPSFFKKLSFEEFLFKRHTNKQRINFSLDVWNSNK